MKSTLRKVYVIVPAIIVDVAKYLTQYFFDNYAYTLDIKNNLTGGSSFSAKIVQNVILDKAGNEYSLYLCSWEVMRNQED